MMLRQTIERDGREYQLQTPFVFMHNVKNETLLRLLAGGLPHVTEGKHVYINEDDFNEFRNANRRRRIETPSRYASTVILGGRVHHPMRWYRERYSVRHNELATLPAVMWGNRVRLIAEEDFERAFWWKGRKG